MNPSRRHFFRSTLAAGASIPFFSLIAAEEEGVTEHFHYRLAPKFPYVESQRGNLAFAYEPGKILFSEDNGKSWSHSANFANAGNITFSCILGNGNIIFATLNRLYLSTDQLKSYREITVQRPDGNAYRPHKPTNPARPGWYFHALDGVHTWQVKGKEMLVWGNYCNVLGGSVPVNIYYSTDFGETVKLAYSFGQNPRYKDGDQFLGDPNNDVICRHIHNVVYNPADNAFYCATGDVDVGVQGVRRHEVHWLRGTYDSKADSWDWKVLVSANNNSRYKSGGINFVDGQLYWAADANGKPDVEGKYDRGIFRCDPADLASPDKHTQLFDPEYESANMLIEDDFILSAHYAPASPYKTGFIVSPDLGKTWAQYDLTQFGPTSPVRIQKKNGDGWFKIDLRRGWIARDRMLFIKPI
jgi:hypothetical protein